MGLRRYSNPPRKATVPGKSGALTVQPGGLSDDELAALLASAGGTEETTEPEVDPCAVTVTYVSNSDGQLIITLTDANGDPITDATVTVVPA